MRELKFLARRIKNMRIFPQDINGQTCTRKELIAVGLNDRNPVPLMFQTGYLTIGRQCGDDMYQLRFPNLEVEKGFYEGLQQVFLSER